MELYKTATLIDPKNDDAYKNLGDIFYREKKYNEAIKYYNEAIGINPNNKKCYKNKARSLYQLGHRREVVECLKEVIRIDPKNHHAYYLIGNIYFDKKWYETAIKYYSAAII